MLVDQSEITNFIPHRSPFIMVDGLEEATESKFVSILTVKEDNIFTIDGVLGESALIENVAQTCALGFGYRDKDKQSEPQIGFIGAISKLKLEELPKTGDSITTVVETKHKIQNVLMIQGVCTSNGRELLRCEMKVVVAAGDRMKLEA